MQRIQILKIGETMWNWFHLLGKYDEKLGRHLQAATVFSGLCNHIQNVITDCAATVILNEIKNEISNSLFVAIILDEFTSFCIWYNVIGLNVINKFYRLLTF